MTSKLDTAIGLLTGAHNTVADLATEAFLKDGRSQVGSPYNVFSYTEGKIALALADLTAYKNATQPKD